MPNPPNLGQVQVVEGYLESAVVDSDLKCEMGVGLRLLSSVTVFIWYEGLSMISLHFCSIDCDCFGPVEFKAVVL